MYKAWPSKYDRLQSMYKIINYFQNVNISLVKM